MTSVPTVPFHDGQQIPQLGLGVWQVEDDVAAARLTQLALEAGGRDNITVLVLDLVDGPQVVGDGTVLGALCDPWNVVDAAQVRLPRAAGA